MSCKTGLLGEEQKHLYKILCVVTDAELEDGTRLYSAYKVSCRSQIKDLSEDGRRSRSKARFKRLVTPHAKDKQSESIITRNTALKIASCAS